MRVRVTQKLIDLRDNSVFTTVVKRPGKYIKDKNGKPVVLHGQRILEDEEVEITLRFAIGESCGAVYREETEISAEDKRARARIIEQTFDKEVCDFDDKQVAIIRERIDRAYGPLVISAVDKVFKKLGVKIEESAATK